MTDWDINSQASFSNIDLVTKKKSIIPQIETIRKAIRDLRTEIVALKSVSPTETHPVRGEVANLAAALEEYERILSALEAREEAVLAPYRDGRRSVIHRVFVIPWKIKDIRKRARKLQNDVVETLAGTRDTANSRRSFATISRFASSGRFPLPSELGVDDDCLDAKEKAHFTPTSLREKYQKYRAKMDLPLDCCTEVSCSENSDANTGDSNYRRQVHLRETAMDILQILDRKLTPEDPVLAEKEHYRARFMRLCNQSVATVLYFHYAQFEARLLVEQLDSVTDRMASFMLSDQEHTKEGARDILVEIDTEFRMLKGCMAGVIAHHDTELKKIKDVNEKVITSCDTHACMKTLEVLLSGKTPLVSQFSNIEYGWICRQCSVFEYHGVTSLIEEHMRLPHLKLVDYPGITPVKHTCDSGSDVGGFAEIFKIDREQLDDPRLSTFRHKLNSGLGIKKVKSPDDESIASTESRRCQRLIREFVVWSKLQHENIVPLLGICIGLEDTPFPCPVVPWMEGGDLHTILQHMTLSDKNLPERLSYLRDVAAALDYMHTHPLGIVHGDLKTNNILLHNGRAYLTDFGVSTLSKCKGLSTGVHGNFNFMAPEQLAIETNEYLTSEEKYLLDENPAKPTKFADMYSFGMVFYHVLCCAIPFSSNQTVLISMRKDIYRLPTRHELITNDEHWTFMGRLWNVCPYLRPCASDAYAQMGVFISKIT